MINDLMLLAGVDIPFIEAQIAIHQPTLKEISMIGEESFYTGCGVLNFSKDNLSPEDRINLVEVSNFEILMSILAGNHLDVKQNKVCALMVLSLLFPGYEIKFSLKEITLQKEDEIRSINSENFERFKEILTAMFCLKGRGSEEHPEYNPGGKYAKEIADKIAKGRQKVAEQKGEQKISILSLFASIVAVGQQQDLNEVLNYTVYQLFDQYDRFELREANDMYFRAQLAGARDLKEIDNWRKNIHP
jgi:hypothetical protein